MQVHLLFSEVKHIRKVSMPSENYPYWGISNIDNCALEKESWEGRKKHAIPWNNIILPDLFATVLSVTLLKSRCFCLAKLPYSERSEVNLEKVRQTWLWKLPNLSLLLIPCFCRLFKESLLSISFWMNAWNRTHCIITKLHIQIPIKSFCSLIFLETMWVLLSSKCND